MHTVCVHIRTPHAFPPPPAPYTLGDGVFPDAVDQGITMAATQEATGFCRHCKRDALIRRKGTNHVLHLFLTVFTVGFWSWIWILCAIKIGGWRCAQCGRKASRSLMR